jgi:PIN domain nuclease of toxin-antitoxin system
VGRRALIVADSHAWLWWIDDPSRLSQAAREALDRADEIGVSAISCFELAGLVRRGRIRLDRSIDSWIRRALAAERLLSLPVTPDIAVAAAQLPESFPGDPADRLIYASAQANGATLVTRDRVVRQFDPRSTLW